MPAHKMGLTNQAKHILENLANWPKSTKGNKIVQVNPIEGIKKTFVTHNFADKCSWYQKSVEVVTEELSDSGDHTTYEADYEFIIDLKHGRITGEDNIANVSNYYVEVKIDATAKTEDTDYAVDYEAGTITFSSALAGTETVTMSYYYQNGSEFKIIPDSGKMTRIIASEVNFSKNIIINDATVFAIYVNDSLYKSDKYKNAKDYINCSNLGQGEITAFGGSSKGIISNVVILPWNYPATIDLKSSLAMDLRISLENNVAFTGELATLTLYCLIEDE